MFTTYVVAVTVTVILVYWISRAELEIKRLKKHINESDKKIESKFNQLNTDLNNPKANITRISNALTQLAKDQKL